MLFNNYHNTWYTDITCLGKPFMSKLQIIYPFLNPFMKNPSITKILLLSILIYWCSNPRIGHPKNPLKTTARIINHIKDHIPVIIPTGEGSIYQLLYPLGKGSICCWSNRRCKSILPVIITHWCRPEASLCWSNNPYTNPY